MNSDGQLHAAHLILGYTPISSSFQALKCVIRAKDPCLHRISVATPGFLLPGPKVESEEITTPIPEGIPKVEASSLQQTTSVAISSHPPNIQEEEVVEVADSEDEFEVFNRALSPKISYPDLGSPFSLIIDKMGIQCKPKSSLFDLIESQPGRDAPEKAAQTKSLAPPPALPPQAIELKRKREPKGKEVVAAGQTLPPREDEV